MKRAGIARVAACLTPVVAGCPYDLYPVWPGEDVPGEPAPPQEVRIGPTVWHWPTSTDIGCALVGGPAAARTFEVHADGPGAEVLAATLLAGSGSSFSVALTDPGREGGALTVTFAPSDAGVDYDGLVPVIESATIAVDVLVVAADGSTTQEVVTFQVDAFGRRKDCTGLVVEMGWSTPSDVDPADELGADVDLHVRHAAYSLDWCDHPYDVFWGNPEPIWLESAATAPVLTADVRTPGVERIEVKRPAPEVVYRVGVHYWGDVGLGASNVWVEVSRWGSLAYKSQGSVLLVEGDLWEVVEVSFGSGLVEPLVSAGGTGLAILPAFCCSFEDPGSCVDPKP